MPDLLRIEDLHVTFATDTGPVTAVHGVSLSIAPGEVLALVGESGSGKTVTAKSVLGLLPTTAATRGLVLLGDGTTDPAEDVLTASPARLRALRGPLAAMVFPEPSTTLNPVFTIGWQLAEALRAHGHGRSKIDRRARAIEWLAKVGLPDPDTRVNHYPHELSGGQKQRVLIAMALATGAKLIVADEPTTALDTTAQADILALLHSCRTDFGTALLLITHNTRTVADIADRVATMREGRIMKVVEQSTARSLYPLPGHAHTPRPSTATPAVVSRGTGHAHTSAADAEQPVVRADRLVVDYPRRLGRPSFRAVDRATFVIRPNEVLGLVGASGSGKTTIGRAIAGLTRVTAGEIYVFGRPLTDRRSRHRRTHPIGYVFQDPAASFNPQLTIGDSVAEPLTVHQRHLGPRAIRARVESLLDAVHLPSAYRDRYPHELSGGQRQRASLARALALNPRLVIADEPTSALDLSVQARVLDLFTTLQQELGFAALFISHDLTAIDQVANRVVIMQHGRLAESASTPQALAPHVPPPQEPGVNQ
ncbi:putative ABC transporter ATP-binding protein YejF [Streptomyces davaonensis JCM 4913]|uniref:Putative ABC transporter ATP-binding protein YejF n=1 Tax=Streptomyces davaonensis (strain DSM 101723 / JCM 4913 / KCC S-0913 / 768) TaxID=1214101 RepID=K4RG67_STRDJ|nr:ABC transporter ATP-binding protein [Streptomyces davaonensis]CCK32149.1 putative ABC transporter ATP-binding protein YejF [Streptomyces davaonensis JCM 4913]